MASGLYIERKREFHIWRWLFVLLFVVLLCATGWLVYHWYTTGQRPPFLPLPAAALADPGVNETPVSLSAINSYQVGPTEPRYISIPALGVSKARVQQVGLTANRTLDMPKNINDAAWYKESAFPGQGYGAVLIDGHNGGISRDGVFARLDSLKKDDEITIERGDGKKITYAVVENRIESVKDANTTGMQRLLTPFNQTQEGLGLITYAGNWIPRDKVFDQRILIRAVAK